MNLCKIFAAIALVALVACSDDSSSSGPSGNVLSRETAAFRLDSNRIYVTPPDYGYCDYDYDYDSNDNRIYTEALWENSSDEDYEDDEDSYKYVLFGDTLAFDEDVFVSKNHDGVYGTWTRLNGAEYYNGTIDWYEEDEDELYPVRNIELKFSKNEITATTSVSNVPDATNDYFMYDILKFISGEYIEDLFDNLWDYINNMGEYFERGDAYVLSKSSDNLKFKYGNKEFEIAISDYVYWENVNLSVKSDGKTCSLNYEVGKMTEKLCNVNKLSEFIDVGDGEYIKANESEFRNCLISLRPEGVSLEDSDCDDEYSNEDFSLEKKAAKKVAKKSKLEKLLKKIAK